MNSEAALNLISKRFVLNYNLSMTKKKRPNDPVALAKLIGDIATGQTVDDNGKDPKAVARGKAGGKVRADKLNPKKKKEIALKGAQKRWSKD